MSTSNTTPTPPPPDQGTGAAPPVAAPRKKSWFVRHKIVTGILGFVLLIALFGAVAGDGADSTAAPAEPSSAAAGADEEGTDSSAGSPGSRADESAAEEDVSAGETAAEEAAAADVAPEEDAPEKDAPEEDAVQNDASGIGDTVAVGDFEVTVTGIEASITRVGDQYVGEEPQGQFVKVDVTVANTGSSAEYFHDSEQKLVDEQSRQHSTSSASFYLDEDNLWLSQINPGNTANGALLYDIPADATPTTLQVTTGFFGNPTDISLEQ